MTQLKYTFNKQYYLPAVCDGEGGNPFANIYFHNDYAYASDKHALVRVPLALCLGLPYEESKKLNGFCIPAKLMKILYNFDPIQIELGDDMNPDTGEFVKTCTIWVSYSGAKLSFELARNTDEKMPDFEAIFSTAYDERKPIRQIGINPGTLKDLAKAMNLSTIAMRFTSADKKIYVDAAADPDGYGLIGVIMPVVLEGTLPGFEDDGDDDTEE